MKTIDYQILEYLRSSPFKLGVKRRLIVQSVINPATGKEYPRTTVYESLVRLLVKGIIGRRSKTIHRSKGRPAIYWRALI